MRVILAGTKENMIYQNIKSFGYIKIYNYNKIKFKGIIISDFIDDLNRPLQETNNECNR